MERGKTIITGSGRCGTTFLIQLLTRLDFNTGFTPYEEPYIPDLRAGSEWEGNAEDIANFPEIIKGPIWAFYLKRLLEQRLIEIRHIILPIRDLDLATKSRLDVGLKWHIPPDAGLIALEEMQQNLIMAAAVGRVVESCMLYSIPCTTMLFPLLVENESYCYRQLSEVFNIDKDKFHNEFNELARPEQIKWKQ